MIKRTPLDAAFSDAVRWSYDWQCQFSEWRDGNGDTEGFWHRCGMNWPECKGQDAHNSHFIGRKHSALRWFPDNCVLMCAHHHAVVTDDPGLHTSFMRRHLGDARYEMLRIRKAEIRRYRARDKKEMLKHFKEELERLKYLRSEGEVGHIPLVSWD